MIDFDLSFAFMFHIHLNLTSFSFGVGFFSSGQLFGLMSLLDAFIFQLCVYFSCVSHQQIRAGLLQCYCYLAWMFTLLLIRIIITGI